MAYAIFKTGGKQYRVQEGDTISVDKLPVVADEEITPQRFPQNNRLPPPPHQARDHLDQRLIS